jgi:hypothetical protein
MHGRIPDPPHDWPSPARMDILLAVASAVENRTLTNRRLRQFLELPARTPITENVLMETLTWESYFELIVMYSERLTQGARTGRMDADT